MKLGTAFFVDTVTSFVHDGWGLHSSVANMAYNFENQLGYHEDESSDATVYFYDPFFHLKSEVKLAGSSAWFVWDADLMVRVLDSGGQRSFSKNDGQNVVCS